MIRQRTNPMLGNTSLRSTEEVKNMLVNTRKRLGRDTDRMRFEILPDGEENIVKQRIYSNTILVEHFEWMLGLRELPCE